MTRQLLAAISLAVFAVTACGSAAVPFDQETAEISCEAAVKERLSYPDRAQFGDPIVESRDDVHYTVRGIVTTPGAVELTYGCAVTKTGEYTHTITLDRLDKIVR